MKAKIQEVIDLAIALIAKIEILLEGTLLEREQARYCAAGLSHLLEMIGVGIDALSPVMDEDVTDLRVKLEGLQVKVAQLSVIFDRIVSPSGDQVLGESIAAIEAAADRDIALRIAQRECSSRRNGQWSATNEIRLLDDGGYEVMLHDDVTPERELFRIEKIEMTMYKSGR